jgi:hypothetical protein
VAVDACSVVDLSVGGFGNPAAGVNGELGGPGFGPDTTSTVTPDWLAVVVTAWPV